MTIARTTLAFLLVAMTGVAQSASKPAAQKPLLSPTDAKRLVAEAFGADAKKAAAARSQLLGARPEDRKAVFDALAQMPFRPPTKPLPASQTLSFDLADAPAKKGIAIVELPQKYDGKTPFPLIFRLHGSGDTAAEFSKNTPDPAFKNAITVTPEIPSADRMGWNQPGALPLLDAALRHALRNYAVDPDRVYTSGHSAGGGASFIIAQMWPHRFAAFFAMARLHWKYHPSPEPCMDVLKAVPGFFVVGLSDTEERVSGFRTAEAYYKKNGLSGEFRFIAGQGHTYIRDQAAQAFAFLLKQKRATPPKDFRALFYRYSNTPPSEEPLMTRQYWLEATKHEPPCAPCHVTVAGNAIEIDGPNLQSGAVLLNDQIVNLDSPVTIKLNGKTVHDGPVERSVEFLLDWFDKERDRGQLYWNRITF
jgi:predicted esterase